MGNEMNELTLSVEQAAKALSIGRGLAYELARRGELPGVLRLGNRFVVGKAALLSALGNAQTRELIADEDEGVSADERPL